MVLLDQKEELGFQNICQVFISIQSFMTRSYEHLLRHHSTNRHAITKLLLSH